MFDVSDGCCNGDWRRDACTRYCYPLAICFAKSGDRPAKLLPVAAVERVDERFGVALVWLRKQLPARNGAPVIGHLQASISLAVRPPGTRRGRRHYQQRPGASAAGRRAICSLSGGTWSSGGDWKTGRWEDNKRVERRRRRRRRRRAQFATLKARGAVAESLWTREAGAVAEALMRTVIEPKRRSWGTKLRRKTSPVVRTTSSIGLLTSSNID